MENIELLTKQIYGQAMMMGSCKLFKGTENLQQLIRLFISPQGLEFCMEHHFPNIATLRLFKGMHVEDYGIYIDAGPITLENPGRAIIIGRTSATINCDTLVRHEVILMHGAKATVNAKDWSVVFVKASKDSFCLKNTYNHALVL